MRLMLLAVSAAMLFLTGCGPEPKWASDVDVSRASYREPGASYIELYTMISNSSGGGGHSALVINGSEKVLYDPAGSWRHPLAPERNDLHYGFTQFQENFYIDFHARTTYHVVIQRKIVSTEIADALIRSVQQQGAAPKAYCTRYNSTALRRVPGFESLRTTWYPVNLMEQFAELPGVQTRKVFDDDPDYNRVMLEAGIVPIPANPFVAPN